MFVFIIFFTIHFLSSIPCLKVSCVINIYKRGPNLLIEALTANAARSTRYYFSLFFVQSSRKAFL